MSWIINSGSLTDKISRPKIFNLTDFNFEVVKAFKNTVDTALNVGQPFLPINIESYGGEVYPMIGILSIMDSAREMGLKFVTYTASLAASSGAMVFAYGDTGHRFIGPSAKLMFHNMSGGSIGKVPECLYDIQKINDLETEIFEKLSKHLKKNKSYLTKMLEKKKNFDWELSAQEALAEGVATAIKVPNFILTIKEEYGIV